MNADPTRTQPEVDRSPLDETVEKVGDGLLSSLVTGGRGITCMLDAGGGGGGGKTADCISGLDGADGGISVILWHCKVPNVACKKFNVI